MIVMREKWELP